MFTRLREQEGAIALLTAFILLALMSAAAVAVDVGRLALSSRDQQGATDRAALDGLLALQKGELDVPRFVDESMALNTGVAGTGMSSERSVTRLRPVSCGPQPGQYTPLSEDAWGDLNANGVEVLTASSVSSLFLQTERTTDVEHHAVACGRAIAAISAAGTTATVDDGLVGALVDGLTGGALGVSLVGWEGLAQAEVLVADLAVALGAGTLDQLLATEVTAGSLVQAAVAALQAGGNTADLDLDLLVALASLDVDIPGLPPFTVGELLEVSTSAEAALATSVDAFGLLLTGLQIANHKSAAAIELDLPGVTGVRLRVVEPPNIAIGPPGNDADGNPLTQARGAQLGLDVRLPIGEVQGPPADLSSVIGQDIDSLVEPYRTRIAEISSCGQALFQSGTTSGTIRSDLERDIDALEEAARSAGLLTVVGGLLGAVEGLLSGLGGLLGCTVAPTLTRQAIEENLEELADTYADLLGALADEQIAPPTSATYSPALSLRLAQATNTLTGVSCAGDGRVESRVRGDAARVAFTAWTDEYVANPDGAPVDLLDVNLGLLRVQVGLELDASLGSSINELVEFPGPFPVHHQQGTAVAGLGSVLSSVTPVVSETQLLGIPLGRALEGVVDAAFEILTPVLTALDPVLSSVVDLLGAELGGVEAAALSADCSGQVLVR